MLFYIPTLIVLATSWLFLLVSVVTYHPLDNSPFFYTDATGQVYNYFGSWGAWLAAWFLYGMGGVATSWCLAAFLFGIYLVYSKKSFFNEWDRLAAWLVGLSAVIGLVVLYDVDIVAPGSPGGYLGVWCVALFAQWGHKTVWFVFMHTLLIASLIVIERFFCVVMMRKYAEKVHAQAMAVYMYRLLIKAMAQGWYGALLIKEGTQFVVRQARLWYHGGVLDEEKNIECARVLKEFLHDLKKQEQPAFVQKNDVQTASAELGSIGTVSSKNVSALEAVEISSIQKPLQQAYVLPVITALKNAMAGQKQRVQDQKERAVLLEEKLARLGVTGSVVSIKSGPVVTVFEYQPHIDTKLSKIVSLEDDLALALSAMSVRIIAPIPGTSVVGFEVANQKRHDVLYSSLTALPEYRNYAGLLPIVLGEDTVGQLCMVDLTRMPHLLVAGSTGSGKSVALNSMLISLLCKKTPDEMKLILIDPKRLEFSAYADIAHLLFPIVVQPKQAVSILQWVAKTMEQRYELMARHGARNIHDYNKTVKKSADAEPMPFVVVCIDELSDLMLTAGREIEVVITRIAQMARAAGIHLIVATQRPSVDVITGLIKVNFPSRISFRVTSRGDSRTILDGIGAERLLGRGDMLFLDSSLAQIRRIHGAYVSDHEIKQVIETIKSQKKVEYLDLQEELAAVSDADDADIQDSLYKEVAQFVQEQQEVSISLLQRKFRIGYNRSARIIEKLEAQGIILPPDGSKTRKVVR